MRATHRASIKYERVALPGHVPRRVFRPNGAVTDRHCAYLQRSEEHTSELQSRGHLVCRLLIEKKNIFNNIFCNIYLNTITRYEFIQFTSNHMIINILD